MPNPTPNSVKKAVIEAQIEQLRTKIKAHAAAAPTGAATLDPFSIFLEDLLDILLTILETIL
jgi:hypothetical protein